MAEAARVHRAAFDERMPWLAGLHTPAEDEAHFSGPVFDRCAAWGAYEDDRLAGFVAFRQDWIDHLYVAPDLQGRGLGQALLAKAKENYPMLRLWTFQRNSQARRFYENRGFVAVQETDGAGNEEREPDVLYEWRA